MRNQVDYKLIMEMEPERKTEHVVENIIIVHEHGANIPDIPLKTLEQVLEAIRLMANGWALTGTRELRSMKTKDPCDPTKFAMTRDCTYDEAMGWERYCVAKAKQRPGPVSETVAYMRAREHENRIRAK